MDSACSGNIGHLTQSRMSQLFHSKIDWIVDSLASIMDYHKNRGLTANHNALVGTSLSENYPIQVLRFALFYANLKKARMSMSNAKQLTSHGRVDQAMMRSKRIS